MKKFTTTLSALILSLIVLFANPGWKRVNYTNSTIFTGIVTVDGEPASEGDLIGVFVGDECRMLAEVFVESGTAYVSSVLHGETPGEEAVIKYWSVEEDKIYDVEGIVETKPAGEISLFGINVVTKEPNVNNPLEVKGNSDFQLFPIPTINEIAIKSSSKIKSIIINNSIGQKVYVIEDLNSTKTALDLSDYDPAVYFLNITFENGDVKTKKIVKGINE